MEIQHVTFPWDCTDIYVQLSCSVLFILTKELYPRCSGLQCDGFKCFSPCHNQGCVFFQLRKILLLFRKTGCILVTSTGNILPVKLNYVSYSSFVACYVQKVPQQDYHGSTTCPLDHLLSKTSNKIGSGLHFTQTVSSLVTYQIIYVYITC